MTKAEEEKGCIDKLNEMGILHYHVFSEPLYNVLNAITSRNTIESINIHKELKNKNFRFYTKDQPALSLEMSNAISTLVKEPKKVCSNFSEMGRRKRTEKADNFARSMYDIIEKIKASENVYTYKETVNALNSKNIKTPLGKKWHINTLQILHNRWKELGIISSENKAAGSPEIKRPE